MTDTAEPTARDAVMGDNSEAMDVKAMLREDPKIIFRSTDILPKLLKQLDQEIEAAPTDVSTKKGRDEIRTRAADIGRLKGTLDKTGLALTEDFRKQVKEVNEVRDEIKEALTARDDKAREKLTEWEEAEKKRESTVRDHRAMIEKFTRVPAGATLGDIEYARKKLADITISEEVFGELVPKVMAELTAALDALAAAEAKIKQDEADKAELAKLREADAARRLVEAQRLADEEAARIKREEEERIRQDEAAKIRAAEQKRVDDERRAEQAERDRLQKIKDDAIEAAAQEQRRIDAAERTRLQAEADEARKVAGRLQAEKEERERIDREKEEERERLAQEEAERIREEEEAAEALRQNHEHRDRIFAEAAEDMVKHGGITAAAAKKLVQAIVAGSVRHTTMEI